ncbi:MAG TPA: DNA polymerase Y family protein [Acidimicrobiales bacterium]|nr:DNA polymerase Y family protein [Acidimicrobiales bacterium]
MTAIRTLVVRCPDWPVIAAGVPLCEPAAVFFANRVVASSPAARLEGVATNMRRREAQGRCPDLIVLEQDPARDAREFEPIVAALDELTPRIEVNEAGRCAFPTHGPARYFGGDDALAQRALALVRAALDGRGVAHVGIADGPFAASLAAADATTVVPRGMSPTFLAPWPLSSLDRPELVDVLQRLGLRTLGDLAALPAQDVLARFGNDGALAHRLASGFEERPPATRPAAPELAVQAVLDEPAERVDTAAFIGRSLADELHATLSARGHVCTRLLIEAETEHGERLERLWRLDHFSAGIVADRVRWQLDGWLNGTAAHRPTAGITRIRLVPDELATAAGRQLGFWGGGGGADERVIRALARVEGLLGPDAVQVPEWCGGRGPGEQVRLVPAGVVDLTNDRPSSRPEWRSEPWPGSLPAPSPATVAAYDVAAEVLDASGAPVRVTGRGDASGAPAWLKIGDRPARRVVAWSGPWPVDERWWDAAGHHRLARFQVVTEDGVARLVVLERGRWKLAAIYD